MSGGGKTSTSTQGVTIPPEVLQRYNAVNTQAQAVAQTPFQQYSTDPNAFVAGINQQQQAGIANTNTAATTGQGYFGAAAGLTGMASPTNVGPVNNQQISQYMNPYIQSVVNPTAQLLNQQQQAQMSGQTGQAIQSGAFGGDRAGIAAANLAGQQSLAFANAINPLYSQGYSQALGAAQQQQGVTLAQQQANNQLLLQQGAQFGNLGAGAQSAALQGAQAQIGAGTLEQQTQQAGLSALYNQFLQQQAYPFQTAQFLANIAEGTGALSGSTTTTTQPSSFFSDERLKEDVEDIGRTHDGQKIVKFRYKGDKGPKQIGLIAQDVEKHHPDAVGLAGGYKTVDYDKATQDAASMGGAVTPEHVGEGFADGGMPSYLDIYGMPGGGASRVPSQVLQQQQTRGLMLPGALPKAPDSGMAQIMNAVNDEQKLSGLAGDAGKLWDKGSAAYSKMQPQAQISQGYEANNPLDPNKAHGGLVGYADGGMPYSGAGIGIPDDQNTRKLATPGNLPGQQQSGMGQLIGAAGAAHNVAGLGSDVMAVLPFLALAHGGLVPREHHADGETVGNDDGSPVAPVSSDDNYILNLISRAKSNMARGWNDAGDIAQNAISPPQPEGPPMPTSRQIEAMQRAKYAGSDAERVAPGMSLTFPPSDVASAAPSAAPITEAGGAGPGRGLVSPIAAPNAAPISDDISAASPDVVPMPPRRPAGLAPQPSQAPPAPQSSAASRNTGASVYQDMATDAAKRAGIDPNDFNRVIGAESSWRPRSGDNSSSGGLLQFHVAGASSQYPNPGIGDAFFRDVHPDLDKSLTPQQKIAYLNDPRNQQEQLEYGAQHIAQNGYGAWTTARKMGLAGSQPNRLASADIGIQNDAGPQGGTSIMGGLGQAASDTGNWFKGNQEWLVPLLTGIGTMASSPSRYLGSAILQGLGGGAKAYSQQQRLTNEQNRLGLSALQNYQSQFQPMYATDGKTVTGYIYKPTAIPMSLEQYNQTISNARSKLMPSFNSEPIVSASGAARIPVSAAASQPAALTVASPEEKYPKDNRGLPALVSGDADSYRARINAVTTLASNMSPDNPNRKVLEAEAASLIPEEIRIRGEGATRATEAKGQRDTSFLNAGQNFLTQYDQNKQAIKETAENYQHYQSGPFAERAKEAGALGSALGISKGANEVAGYDTAQKSAATDALLSKNLYGMSGAPATGAEMGLSATHSPNKAPAANYKILTDKDAALDYQKDMIDGFKASGGKNFDDYVTKFNQTHRLEDYVARSRLNTAPFAGTSDMALKASGIERPAPVGSDTPPNTLVDGKYYTNGGRLLRWSAKRQGFVEPFKGQ